MPYSVIFEEKAREMFLALDKSIRNHLEKKLLQLTREDLNARHLEHGKPFFVAEVGQYRIAFKVREELREKRIIYVGDHKDYDKWCRQQ